jgi:hypothetical protein
MIALPPSGSSASPTQPRFIPFPHGAGMKTDRLYIRGELSV